VLILAILLHLAGALKHHVFDKDATLRRMWSGTAGPSEASPSAHAAPAALALLIWLGAIGLGLALG
jgi:hypothetical protein